MLYQDHWDDVKTRMTGYWEREAMDRCCTAICVKNPDFDPDKYAGSFYFDVEHSDKVHRIRFANHHYFGEAIPCMFPYFGTAGIAEYTGCKLDSNCILQVAGSPADQGYPNAKPKLTGLCFSVCSPCKSLASLWVVLCG